MARRDAIAAAEAAAAEGEESSPEPVVFPPPVRPNPAGETEYSLAGVVVCIAARLWACTWQLSHTLFTQYDMIATRLFGAVTYTPTHSHLF